MTNKFFPTTPCTDELVSQPHANVECKWRKRRGIVGLRSGYEADQQEGAILPPVSRSPFLPRPNPYSATLGLSVIRLGNVSFDSRP